VPSRRTRARAAALRRARADLATAEVVLGLARSLADVTTSLEAAQRIAEAVLPVAGCDRACVLLPEDGRFVVRGIAGRGEDPLDDRLAVVPEQFGVSVEDLPAAIVCRVDDAPEAARDAMVEFGIGALAVVAVRVRATVAAVLTAGWVTSSPVPDAEVLGPRLDSIASQAATALGNAGLLDHARHQALHDALTGLPNRTLFDDRASNAIARARRHGDRVAVAVLDLDRFKTVNDSLGHRAGDALLVQVADRLHSAVRAPDTVARMGGDEFTLLLPELPPHGEAVVAERLLAAFEAPFEVEGHLIRVSPSIGLSAFPADGDTPDRLLRNADAAMYRAKENGRNTWATYASGMHERAYDRLTLEADLYGALDRRELRLGFLPMARVADRRGVAVEALVRWSHPSFGVLGPGEFLPLAEEVGLAADLDAWVLRQACLELGRADAAGHAPARIAVNLSARSLAHPSLVRVVAESLAFGGLAPQRLIVEVSEAVTAHPPDGVLEALADLRAMGVAVALDDFGRGHSPLADLGELPLDMIKLDRSFLAGVRSADDEAPVLAAVIAMAHGLGLQVVAEGVETEEQLAFVRRLGCDLAQGYLLGRAGPSATYAAEGANASTA
jgi:diguanylate cyclase (GGDEF)-like protein